MYVLSPRYCATGDFVLEGILAGDIVQKDFVLEGIIAGDIVQWDFVRVNCILIL